MTDNSKLVNYFINEFLANNSHNLSNVVSPSFSFFLNLGDKQDFNQFATRMQLITTASNLVFTETTTEDDIHFCFDFEIILAPPNEEMKSQGFAQIIAQNNLITQVSINYMSSEEEFEEFQELIKNSPTVLL
ncbi:MAG: hypothetical protein OCD03_13320 [Hyphomicrobiales bacterium]